MPYKIEWKEFQAAAPLLEALGAGAIETGLVGDAPFTFAAAASVPVKAIGAIRQSQEGLAILVPRESPIHGFEDLKGKKIATSRGSIGHQLILAALESKGWSLSDVQIAFLAPSDAKVAYTQGSVDAWSTWEPYVSQEEVLFQSRRVITAEGITPGIGFQVASPAAIRWAGRRITWRARRGSAIVASSSSACRQWPGTPAATSCSWRRPRARHHSRCCPWSPASRC